MSDIKTFLDSNVLIYLFSSDLNRAEQAESLVSQGAIVSVQVLNETTSVLRRKLGFSWPEIEEVMAGLTMLLEVHPLTLKSHKLGCRLAERFGFSVYDAMIVASASLSGCHILYSEDMQHGMSIDTQFSTQSGSEWGTQLTVKNPFIC